MMDPYYYVYLPSRGGPKVKHETYESAEEEAKRLAERHVGESFEILKCVGVASVKGPATVERFEDVEPDDDDWGPWIEWGGGECPLEDDVRYEVRCESEVIDGAYNNASNWVWTHTMGGGNIVAYRIKKEDS